MEECVRKNVVAVLISTAIFLVACGAQPANLPTVTPIKPTSATSVAPTATTENKDDKPSRPFAKLASQDRSKIGTAPPPLTIDITKKYIATIITAKGEIKIELDPSAAPQTVNNFVFLSMNGFYDGLTFHRVETGFVIQGGDPLGNGSGGPGYNVPPEIKLPHVDGAIAMARQGGPAETTPSSGSQFYITIGAQQGLDSQYTVFGHTIAGLDIVRKIAIGDIIERIDVSVSDVAAADIASITPTPLVPAVCQTNPVNVVADDHQRGASDAGTVLLIYTDMQCPACAQVAPALKQVYEQLSDTVRIVVRHFPLTTIHDKAQLASQAVEAASKQDKFWQFYDLLYEKQEEWSAITVTDVITTFMNYAQSIGIDTVKFETDLRSKEVIARVARDVAVAEKLKLTGTPTMYLSGRPFNPSALLQENINSLLREYAVVRKAVITGSKANTFHLNSPDQVINGDAPYILTLKTNKGDIELQLDPKLAPVNVNSTIFLTQKGYFDGVPVDQAVPDLGLVLLGDASLEQNPGYTCGMEPPATGAFSKSGVVAVLNTGADNLSQIIITYSPTEQLESRFTVIGEVTKGLEIVKLLQSADVGVQADRIISATVVKK
jgi:cyclophilin family peptidyl-prolyl cis-trans isomerase